MAAHPLLSQLARALRFAWTWSLFLTVPIVAIFGLWLFRTGTKYLDFGLGYDALNGEINLARAAEYEGNLVARDLRLGMQLRSAQPKRHLRPIGLYLPGSSEAALNGDLPFSGRKYVPGALIGESGDAQEVKMRYRGDHYWHWAGRKKSLRVKTKKSQLYRGMRSFNLIAPKLPEQISGYMSYFLARQFDLIAPRAELVDVHVNGSYRGVHLLLEQLEEMVIREHGRMPGDIYSADIVSVDKYRGLPASVFENAGLWEKVAVNNHFELDSKEPIEALVRALAMPSSRERSLRLRELVDIDAFGRFSAFRTLCQSEHFDNAHNWRLYYDPWRNRFEPIVWDPAGWAITWRPKPNQRSRADISSSPLDLALMEDHAFLAARQRAIETFYSSGGDAVLLTELDRVAKQIEPSLATDPGISWKLTSMSVAEVATATKIYRYFVKLILDQIREDYLTGTDFMFTEGSMGPSSVRVAIGGRRPLFGLQVALTSIPDFPVGARLRYQDAMGALQERDISGSLSMKGGTVDLDLFLCCQLEPDPDRPKTQGRSRRMRPARGVYEVSLYALGDEARQVPAVQGVSGRYAGGEHARAERVESIYPAVFQRATLVADEEPVSMPLTWEGTKFFRGALRVKEDIIIRPGTKLCMGEGASVIFEGRVLAEGSVEAPIRIEPEVPNQVPWGTFALRGHGANGSQFAHVQFIGGSGLKEYLVEYSAMFSIHDVQDVHVSSCAFRDSRVVDDMVHVVYSTVAFDGCAFNGAKSDALDIDISEASVSNCVFTGSGNDALDLMTSHVAAEGLRISGSGDKGISVGENTQLMMVNCSIQDCEIGIQIKDRSRATLHNCQLSQNQKAVDAFRKNWRYGSGGIGFVYKTQLAGNAESVTADRHSRLRFHDCALEPFPPAAKSVVVDKFCEGGGSLTPKFPFSIRFPEDQVDSRLLFDRVWRAIDPQVRGLKPVQ